MVWHQSAVGDHALAPAAPGRRLTAYLGAFGVNGFAAIDALSLAVRNIALRGLEPS